ncbi:hypothetical protein D8B21_20925, partial [Verminephrobacter aporrectodeae subsp. tuberculatae]|uniref:SwmB domain-containing protein n=1 Tax=Verminephrobacter aporrectodeae TaxID=1110389 RepID=UPI002243AF6F
TLSRTVATAETVTVSYTKPTGDNVVQDTAGNDAVSFSNQAVTYRATATDTTPPEFHSAAVRGSELVISYIEANTLLSIGPMPSSSFRVSSTTGTAITVLAVVVLPSSKTVVLTLNRAVAETETVTVSYTKPASGGVQDAAGNYAANFSEKAVTHGTTAADTTAPVIHTAVVTGDQLVLTYTEANTLDGAALAGNAGFTVNTAAGTTAITVTGAMVNATDKTVTLTLSRAVAETETVTVSYTKPTTGNGVRDAAGNNAANFSEKDVTRRPSDTTPPVINAATVNGNQLVLTYTEANTLNAAALAGNAGFTVNVHTTAGTTAILVSGAMVNATAKTVTLTLSRAVANSESVTVSYTKPESGNVVEDAAGNDAADFNSQVVTNNTPAPSPSPAPGPGPGRRGR